MDVLRPDLLRGLSSIHFPSDPLDRLRNSYTGDFAPVFLSLVEPELNGLLPFLIIRPKMTEILDVSSWESSKLGKRRPYRGPDRPKP